MRMDKLTSRFQQALQDAQSLALTLRRVREHGAGERPELVRRALRRYAARRALAGQGWRLGSEAALHLATTTRHAALRDRVLSGSVGRLGSSRR